MSTIAPVTTGADGSFSLGGLTAGSDLLLVSPPDDTHIVGEATVQVSSSEPATADVALQPSGSMSATIEDGSGNPLAGVQTTLLGPGFTGAPNAIQSTPITSGNDGVATATDLPPGSYDLQVEGSTVDHPFTISRHTEPHVHRHRPRRRGGGFRGSWWDRYAGCPVDLLVNGQSVAGTTTSADGSYQFSVTRGAAVVGVLAASNAVGVVSAGGLTATLGSTTEVPTLQAGTGSLQVTVENGAGPVDTATVTLSPNAGVGAVTSTTNGSGETTLSNLTPGSYTLTVGDGIEIATESQAVTVTSTSKAVAVTRRQEKSQGLSPPAAHPLLMAPSRRSTPRVQMREAPSLPPTAPTP